MAAEALSFHIEGLLEDGDAVPEPSSLDMIMHDAENREAVAVLVPALVKAPKIVRVNVTIPEETLRAIDAFAESHGYTRSGFLVTAARRAMEAV